MSDEINNPSHYKIFPDMEVIDIIRKTLSDVEFAGYCKGNSIKYRLRAGEKGPAEVCIGKARKYEEWLKDLEANGLLGVFRISADLPKPANPWYPDDSGEWVEHDGKEMPFSIGRADRVATIYDYEREQKSVSSISYVPANYWDWQKVVAYKVIK